MNNFMFIRTYEELIIKKNIAIKSYKLINNNILYNIFNYGIIIIYKNIKNEEFKVIFFYKKKYYYVDFSSNDDYIHLNK